jgi:hypothetical protein
MDAVALLLATAFRQVINEPNIEAGYEQFAALTGGAVDEGAFRKALAACLRDALIREPIRLPEGALQCHFNAEGRRGGPGTAGHTGMTTRAYAIM